MIDELPRSWAVEIHNTRPVRVVVRGVVNRTWGIPHNCSAEAYGETWQEAYREALKQALAEAQVGVP